MTREEVFTLIALKQGKPRALITSVRRGGKAPITEDKLDIDYIIEFSSLAALHGFPCETESELVKMHRDYLSWYNKNLPT